MNWENIIVTLITTLGTGGTRGASPKGAGEARRTDYRRTGGGTTVNE